MALKIETETRRTYRILIYGDAKTGKTTTAATFPAPVIVQDATTRGADFVKAPRATLNAIDELSNLAANLRGEKYKTVVLDDFSSMVARWLQNYDEKDERKAYAKLYKIVVPAVQMLCRLPVNLIITTHYTKGSEVDPKTYRDRTLVHPNLPQALDVFVRGAVDVVGYAYVNGSHNLLTQEKVTDKARIVAGTRTGIALPERIQLDALSKTLLK